MTKGTNIKAHVTGEKNLSNIDGDVLFPDKKSNINYNKTLFSTNGFLIGISLLMLFIFQVCFCWYISRELNNYKQELFLKQQELEKQVNDRIDLQAKTINQFIYTYGEY